uniref:Zn-dependent peptidase ImmA, M78 family n=1 Tax=Candidatus Kentrum sp. FW TaxID=2126338 RepID=A0A450U4K4_9GAMM|nr:MAG: Zn-dependent peptidase ImmA, M78 family [Candidatus Kentron sp. FW]
MIKAEYHGLYASDFLDELEKRQDLRIDAPVDVEKIALLLGVRITDHVDLGNINTVGSISIKNNTPVIWVNPVENSYRPRRRFTIAHEIGHLVLHIEPDIGVNEFLDTKATLNRRDSHWDIKEYEANNFAAQILMPMNLLNKYGNEIIDRHKNHYNVDKIPRDTFIDKMCDKFVVSDPAMTFRLKRIGVIS